jgi:hypothetical protein
MHDNTEHMLEILSNTFSDYLMKNINDSKLEEKLSKILSNIDLNGKTKNFEIAIVNNSGQKEPFFGMRIFPVITDMNVVLNALVNEKKSFQEIYKMWGDIKNFYIEIDSLCFDRNSINFIPQELTALVIHELGHVVYSDKAIEIFYRAYQESYMRMKIAEKASLKFLYLLYTIPLSASCMLRKWTNGKNEINIELFADSFLKEYNYTEYLISAIGKIVKRFGNTIMDSEIAKCNKIESSVAWCGINIIDLTRRKNKLKDELYYKTVKTNSGYIKALSMKILTDLGLKMHETYTGAAIESTLDRILEDNSISKYSSAFDLQKIGVYERAIENTLATSFDICLESRVSNKTLKPPTQYDIDAISVEMDRIENHNDRIYVLDLIYHKESEIYDFIEIIEKDENLNRKYHKMATSMINQLEDIRKKVLLKKSFNKDYKVFVKYPDGYEG